MRITSKQISKAIEAATGVAGVKVYIDRRAAVCHYYTDEPSVVDHFEETTVYTTRLSDSTLEDWVQDFQSRLTVYLEEKETNQ